MQKPSLPYIILFVVACMLPLSVHGQSEQRIWYFGIGHGLDFALNPPLLLKDGAIRSAVAASSICNAKGELQFYTDGQTVYNAKHAEMPNGFGLAGNSLSTQGATIVPDPASTSRYYIFTLDRCNSKDPRGLCYSLVDMSEDGGRGDVIIKNIPLLDSTSEMLGAVSTCDREGYWIIVNKVLTDEYYTFHLSKNGIDPEPVISRTGTRIAPLTGGVGWMAVSPNGRYLAMAHGSTALGPYAELVKFDLERGSLYDPIRLPILEPRPYGAAFAADGNRVYISLAGSVAFYDLTRYDSLSIVTSRRNISSASLVHLQNAMRLGPDGVIYVSSGNQRLGRIPEPSSPNPECALFYELGIGDQSSISLPSHSVILADSGEYFQYVAPKYAPLSICTTEVGFVKLINQSCVARTYTEAQLIQNDDVFSLDTIGMFPLQLSGGASVEIPIRFAPDKSPAVFNAAVKLVGNEAFTRDRTKLDTVLTFSAEAIPEIPKLSVSPIFIDFGKRNLCAEAEREITLTNLGCEPFAIDKFVMSGAYFEFVTPTTPSLLQPNQSILIKAIFAPREQGVLLGRLEVNASNKGVQAIERSDVTGFGTDSLGFLEVIGESKIDISDYSICSEYREFSVELRNTGCDTLAISSASLTGATSFTLLTPISNLQLAQDSAVLLRFKFESKVKGQHAAKIAILWSPERKNSPQQIDIQLSARVSEGSKILTSSSQILDFGIANICASPEQLLTITNDGCDTLIINGQEVSGSFVVDKEELPLRIPPGEKTEIRVTSVIDTTGHQSRNDGSIEFFSNATSGSSVIPLLRQYSYPRMIELRMGALSPAHSEVGKVVELPMISEGSLSGIRTINIELEYNADVLSNVTMSNGKLLDLSYLNSGVVRQRIQLSEPFQSPLCRLSFDVRLAAQLSSTLSITNVRLNEIEPDFESCVAYPKVSSTLAEFVNDEICGDGLIRKSLSDGKLISSLSPNPSSQVVSLELLPSIKNFRTSVFDLRGNQVYAGTTKNIIVRNLSSGQYELVVTANGQLERRIITVIK